MLKPRFRHWVVVLALVGAFAPTAVAFDDSWIDDFVVDDYPMGYHTATCSAGANSSEVITLIIEMFVDNVSIGLTYQSGQNPRVQLSRQVEWADHERQLDCVVYGGAGNPSASATLPDMW